MTSVFPEKGVCEMERDSGPCTDPLTQWYFDSSDKECKQFTYGGCRGNGNRFNTKLQCQEACQSSSEQPLLNPHGSLSLLRLYNCLKLERNFPAGYLIYQILRRKVKKRNKVTVNNGTQTLNVSKNPMSTL